MLHFVPPSLWLSLSQTKESGSRKNDPLLFLYLPSHQLITTTKRENPLLPSSLYPSLIAPYLRWPRKEEGDHPLSALILSLSVTTKDKHTLTLRLCPWSRWSRREDPPLPSLPSASLIMVIVVTMPYCITGTLFDEFMHLRGSVPLMDCSTGVAFRDSFSLKFNKLFLKATHWQSHIMTNHLSKGHYCQYMYLVILNCLFTGIMC